MSAKLIMNQKIDNSKNNSGGSSTNYYGKKFEENTDNTERLIKDEFKYLKINKKKYLYKKFIDKNIYFLPQTLLKLFIQKTFNIELSRLPDEAYLIIFNNGKKVLKILEKKEQRVEGSVETKLWASPSLKREYELILGIEFIVEYGLCVNMFLKNKFISDQQKYIILNKILAENNIPVFFGDDENYFELLDKWILKN